MSITPSPQTVDINTRALVGETSSPGRIAALQKLAAAIGARPVEIRAHRDRLRRHALHLMSRNGRTSSRKVRKLDTGFRETGEMRVANPAVGEACPAS
jgi:hypothetical protein